jgi:hypothetical protein
MPGSPADKPDTLPKLIGEAIVSWSQIEAVWAHIFFHLVYDGLGAPLGIDTETGTPMPEEDPHWRQKRARAAAVFFSVPNSKNQRRMVVELAAEALKAKPEIFASLKKLAGMTDTLSEWRNKFAHAYYERPMTFQNNQVLYGPIAVSQLGKYQYSEVEATKKIAEFEELLNLMNQVMLATMDLDDPPKFAPSQSRRGGQNVRAINRKHKAKG